MNRNRGRPLLGLAVRLAWLLALPAFAFGLDPRKAVTQYVHDVWHQEQGLPANTVKAILQTRDGYLWLGTQEGLARFDGVRFTVYDRRNNPQWKSNFVLALAEDGRGGLWIGTDGGGVSCLRDGRMTTWTTREGLADDFIGSLCAGRDGSVWLATGKGLDRLVNGRITCYTTAQGLSSDGIRAVWEDRGGVLWILTRDLCLHRLRDGRITPCTTREGFPGDKAWSIGGDREGNLLVVVPPGQLYRYRDGRFGPCWPEEGVKRYVLEDRHGNFWGFTPSGVCRFRDGWTAAFSVKEGLSSEGVWALCEDREGSLWIGTDNGLNRLRDGKITAYTTREGLPDDNVSSVCAGRDGGVWIGTYSGVLGRLEKDKVTAIPMKAAEQAVYSMCEDRHGALWVGGAAGLACLTAGRVRTYSAKDGMASGGVWALYEDRLGCLWAGTMNSGLSCLRDGRFTTYTTQDGLSNNGAQVILEDQGGTLWIGTGVPGLSYLRDGKLSIFRLDETPRGRRVLALYSDRKGVLWIGTWGGGLFRLKGGRITAATSADGLFDDTIYSIFEDGSENLWMSCNKGIFRTGKRELNAFAEGKLPRITCAAYGVADGMKSAECNGGTQSAGCRTGDGRLWFPTVRGIAVIDPGHIPVNTVRPPVHIEEVIVDGRTIRKQPGINLPPGLRKIEFHYTAPIFVVPERVRFRYKLDGWDKEWTDAGARRVAYYTNLGHGRYRFRVAACNDDGLWNETGAGFAFSLAPHYYETWWFYSLAVAVLLVLAGGAHRLRVRQLRARERELTRLVDQRTQEVREQSRQLAEQSRELAEANAKIARLLDSTPGASQSLSDWSTSMAGEIAKAIGAERIGIWAMDRGSLSPFADGGLPPPSLAALRSLQSAAGQAFADPGSGTVVPVAGMSGELCGALVISGQRIAWGDTERRLVAGFARQLGGALEMSQVRRQLAAAEEKRAATRREMHERGIATLQVCPACGFCGDNTLKTCPHDGSPLESPRILPYLLLGRYRFLQVLGQGGMGMVLSAHDDKLDRLVAIKFLRPEHFGNAELKERFQREARAVARIAHPGVIALHDSGEMDDGTAFMVMEKLAGCDLGRLLRVHGRGHPRQVAELVRQGGAALQAAHQAGIVHRDIKPENIFLLDEAAGFRVKVLDFGVAMGTTFEEGLTRTGGIVGTPTYMAPEQVQGSHVDTRADLYSFAAVCYEALTGQRTVTGNNTGRILINLLTQVPAPVSAWVTGIPAEVDAAFQSALAKDPDRRPPDIGLWASALATALAASPDDPAIPGWPASPGEITKLGESRPDARGQDSATIER